jgi:hypothetical protein
MTCTHKGVYSVIWVTCAPLLFIEKMDKRLKGGKATCLKWSWLYLFVTDRNFPPVSLSRKANLHTNLCASNTIGIQAIVNLVEEFLLM